MLVLHTQSLPHYGLERSFEFAAQAGLDGIEINVNRGLDSHDPAYLKVLEARYNLRVRAFSIHNGDEDDLLLPFQETVKHFPGTMMVLASPQVLSFNKYGKWMESIMPALAKKYELEFCRRNTPFTTYMGIIPQRSGNSIASLREAGNVCLDVSALAVTKEDLLSSLQIAGKRLRYVYLSNYHQGHPYALPTTGILPLESMLMKLARHSFSGDFALRLDPRALHEGDKQKMLERLIECREFYEQYFVANIPQNDTVGV